MVTHRSRCADEWHAAAAPVRELCVSVLQSLRERLPKRAGALSGLLKDEQAGADALDKDGFLHTGDFGRVDEYGMLYVTARKSEILTTSRNRNLPTADGAAPCEYP